VEANPFRFADLIGRKPFLGLRGSKAIMFSTTCRVVVFCCVSEHATDFSTRLFTATVRWFD